MNIIQEGLIYITCLFLLLATLKGFFGATRMKRFERNHWTLLRFISLLTCLNVGVVLAGILSEIWFGGDLNQLFDAELLIFVFVAVWIGMGMGKIRTALVHGKKFKVLFSSCGVALILLIVVLFYLKFWKLGSFVF